MCMTFEDSAVVVRKTVVGAVLFSAAAAFATAGSVFLTVYIEVKFLCCQSFELKKLLLLAGNWL